MRLYLLLTFLLFQAGFVSSQNTSEILDGKWLVEMTHNDIGVVRSVLQFDTKDSTFVAYSRKHADKDLFGKWKSFLGRTFSGSFKNGSLLHIINGRIRSVSDTVKLLGILTSAIGNYYFRGFIKDGQIHAILLNAKKENIGKIISISKNFETPIENYPALADKAIVLTKDKIYNRALTETADWKTFVDKMHSTSLKIQDDLEMVFAFFFNAGKLPVTHYSLMKMPPANNDEDNSYVAQHLFLEEKTPKTAYLKITSFSGKAQEVDSIFNIIISKAYDNLIVDLRENPGGSVEAGMAFASHLADSTYYGGIFLTQKWFSAHKTLPTLKEYPTFTSFTAANFDLIISGIHNTDALCLRVIPDKKIYKGKLFVLTDGETASTCEPIVYSLKQTKRAIIVGEKTAGAMMNGEYFDLDKGFKMVIPTADYYTSDGYKIDKKGVVPNVIVKKDKALLYILDNLVQK